MDTEANKSLVRRFIADVFEGLRPDAVNELVADDFKSQTWKSSGDSKATLRATTERMAKLLTNVHFVVDDFMGMPSAGKSYEIGEIHIFRVSGGNIAEHWHQYDAAGMMRQLGGGD